eukprot:8888137-Pyramimonas_sp.AAC.1
MVRRPRWAGDAVPPGGARCRAPCPWQSTGTGRLETSSPGHPDMRRLDFFRTASPEVQTRSPGPVFLLLSRL